MSNPLSSLAPYLKLLSKEVKILPAVGGATEELLHPDIEEVEEAIVDRNIENVTSFGETPEPDPRCLYHPTPSLTRKQKNVYHFFVDGSIRTYFLGTGIEGRRSFPIEMAQIG
ncbi:MAG TPA: hypothetical protein GX009_10370, partial [Candidatus Atribacteria bacterium]|nr:hypothetical protein [Candidatus Atribacteria bacterium]